MDPTSSIEVNLADPADIRSKLPEIKQFLEEQRRRRAELDEQIEFLSRVVGEPASASSTRRPGRKPSTHRSPGQNRAVAALEKANRPMGPKALFDFMTANGMDAPTNTNTLGANLWAAERAGRIKKVDGKYVPLGYRVTDYEYAGRIGFPVSDHLPRDDGDEAP